MGFGAVDRLIAESRAEACAAGRKIAAVYEIACAAPVAEFAAVEVACALTLSRFAAEGLVELASALCERLPSVLGALSKGDIDLPKARVFTEVLADVDLETARSVAAAVLPKAPSRTSGQLRDMLRRKALAADPAYTTTRREHAAAHRSVQLHAADDGTASLVAFGLDATRTTAAMQRIAAIARQRRFAGDPATAEQLRADIMLELLEGKHEGAARGVVNLSVSLETLARLNDDPATIGGYGPIAADIARQWAEAHLGYRWQYAIHDANGTLLQTGLTRSPSRSATDLAASYCYQDSPRRASSASGQQNPGAATSPASVGPAAGGLATQHPGTMPQRQATPEHPTVPRRSSTAQGAGSSLVSAGAPAASPNWQPQGAKAGGSDADLRWREPGASRRDSSGAGLRGASSKARADRPDGEATSVGVGDGEEARGVGGTWVRPPTQDPHGRSASAAMVRWIRLRDKTCRAPGCRMPAWQSDIDHNQRYSQGGLTAHDNLCALCRYHHRAKDQGGWALVQSRPGHFIWISPQGRVYEVGPEPP
jgi:hypothetical protein